MAKNTRRKSGKRDKSGRLAKATTRAERNVAPNDKVRERIERFSHKSILGGKAGHDAHDGPGQLHAMSYFHGREQEPDVIRDVLREYAEHYWYWFACLDSGSAKYGPRMDGEGGISPKSSPLPPKAKAERRFQALEECLPKSLGSPERIALHAVAVGYWGSDTVHPFVERLVNDGMVVRKLPVAGMLATQADRDTLEAAIRAAIAMIEGRQPVEMKLAA